MKNTVAKPDVHPEAYVAPGVWITGDVRLAAWVSVWYGSVLRGDMNFVEVGEGTNIQDQCLLHVTSQNACRVGAWVTVGHQVVLHGCTVADRCLIGMGAIVLTGAVIGEGSTIGAGCVVTEGTQIPPGSLVLGVPGRVIRSLRDEEKQGEAIAREYLELARQHRQGKFPLYRPTKKPEVRS